MREHPVPQNVTSYEFHLIGNMTLKQFFELGAGIVVALLIYSTNLLAIVKWPLILLFVLLGIVTAFVPFEGRPLDKWFLAFIRAIYKPTEFYWRKSGKIPDYLLYTSQTTIRQEQELNLTPLKHQRIAEYIQTLPGQRSAALGDDIESTRILEVLNLFDEVMVDMAQATPTPVKPSITLEARGLQPLDKLLDYEDTEAEQVQQLDTSTAIPQTTPIELAHEEEKQTEATADLMNQAQTIEVFSSTTADHAAPEQTITAQTSQDLPFPKRPTIPNLIVGMVFDQFNKIVENAIVEIQDEQGMPVRAVKTNSIGQFFISTPLENGRYIVKIDKEGLSFIPQELTLQKNIVDPLLIQAQATA